MLCDKSVQVEMHHAACTVADSACGQMQDLSSDPGTRIPLAPAGRPSRLRKGYQRLCNKASNLNPWRKVILGSFCTLPFMLFATLQMAVWLSRAGGTVLTCSCNDYIMSCIDNRKTCSCKSSVVLGVCRHALDHSLHTFLHLLLHLHWKTWRLSPHLQWWTRLHLH